jgi:hypothetical protein
MRSLSEEIDKQGEEILRDIRAYEAYLATLEKDQCNALSEEEFLKEKKKVTNLHYLSSFHLPTYISLSICMVSYISLY